MLAKRLEAEGAGVRICTDDVQAELGVPYQDSHFHERLQLVLYRHALAVLENGTDVILEDGLWTRAERAQKFADAHLRGAHIVLHVFDVPRDLLWARLQERAASGPVGAYPMSAAALQSAWEAFQPPTPTELADIDEVRVHSGTSLEV